MISRSRSLSLILALALTFLTMVAVPTSVVRIEDKWLVAGVLAIIAGFCAIWLSRTQFTSVLPPPLSLAEGGSGFPPIETASPISLEFARYAQENFARRYGEEALIHLIAMMVAPRGHTSRISEHFVLADDVVHLTSARTVTSSARDDLLIPALRAKKGVLVDNFRVSFDGRNVSTLSYLESQGAILSAVETFFYQMFPERDYPVERVREAALKECLLVCGAESVVGSNDRQELTNSLRCLMSTATRAPSPFMSVFLDLVDALQKNYFIIAAVKSKHCIRRKMVTELTESRKDSVSGVGSHLRRFLGLPRREFHISIPASGETHSYHATIEIPAETYLCDANIWITELSERSNLAELCDVDGFEIPEIATANAQTSHFGLGYLHVYTRNPFLLISDLLPEGSKQGDYITQVSGAYRERPPGSLAVALPVAIFLLILTWAVGHFFHAAFPNHSGVAETFSTTIFNGRLVVAAASPSPWPAVILGIPALVSAWVLTRLSREYLQRMSLATLALILWMIANAGAAVALAAVDTAGVGTNSWSPFAGFRITHFTWTLLMFSTCLNFMLMAVALCVRTARYWTLLNSDNQQ